MIRGGARRGAESYLRVPSIRLGLQALALAAGGLVVALHGVAGAAAARRAVLRDELVAARTEAAVLRARLDRSVGFAETEAQLTAVEARYGAAADRSRVVGLLSALSAESGVRILHAANRFGPERAGHRPVLQDLTVEGELDEILRFLGALSGIETLTLLQSAAFAPSPGTANLRVDLELVTFSGDGA